MGTTFDASNGRRSESFTGRRLSLILFLILLALVLIVLDGQGVLDPVKSQAQRTLQPLAQTLTQTRLAVRETFGSITGRGAAQQELDTLRRELQAEREKNIQLQTLMYENRQLKQQLQIEQTYGWTTIDAKVVRGSTDNGQRIVRINRGNVDGIEVGMAVVAQEGGSPTSLIGVVDKVYAQNADVLLIIDYGSTISARTAGTETPADGLVTGQWQVGSRLKLSDVSRDAVMQPGHYVVTAGLSKALSTDTPIAQVPADVPIGTILEVKQAGHSQTAEVQPFVNPDRVRNLWVITGLRTEDQ